MSGTKGQLNVSGGGNLGMLIIAKADIIVIAKVTYAVAECHSLAITMNPMTALNVNNRMKRMGFDPLF